MKKYLAFIVLAMGIIFCFLGYIYLNHKQY